MSSVELGDFFERGGYFVHVATAYHHGVWLAWAEFKQHLEYSERCLQVPVYRHWVPKLCPSKAVAVETGLHYAHQAIDTGTVVVRQASHESNSGNLSLH